MKKRIKISGKINPDEIDKIRENLETYQNEKAQMVEISIENVSAEKFDHIARLVETLKDTDMVMEIHSNSDISLIGLAALSATNVTNRKGQSYYTFNFSMPDAYEEMNESDKDKLSRRYVQLLRPLLREAKSEKDKKTFNEETLLKYLKEGTTISYDKAVELGILRGFRRSSSKSIKTEKEVASN